VIQILTLPSFLHLLYVIIFIHSATGILDLLATTPSLHAIDQMRYTLAFIQCSL
jgi:hypothetical protein